jgi:S-adenosylmethionine:tRNA ribosyltransferase-isomerase
VENDTSAYDYDLPLDRIAQSPAEPRETANLMVVDRKTGTTACGTAADLPQYLKAGDLLVVNNSKVFRARLIGTMGNQDGSTRRVELFLVRPTGEGWLALGKPGKRCRPGTLIGIAPEFSATVVDQHDDGTLTVDFGQPNDTVIALANRYGHVPVPPYIKREPDADTYQTAYAKRIGSVAAPTAGFHLTEPLLAAIRAKGVTVAEITLHVGLGTFMPIKTESLAAHRMHAEWVAVSPETAAAVSAAKREGRRIVAVGTTTVRTLEGVAARNGGTVTAYEGDINLFITPGFRFAVVGAMLTNFHLPKSTLIVLVSAFAGHDLTMTAYRRAVASGFRFYSFGDAMFIV